MNKWIFGLVFLLLLLIVTCVYQKAESIYQLKYPLHTTLTTPQVKTIQAMPKIAIPMQKKEKPILLLEELKASLSQDLAYSNAIDMSKEESKKMMDKAIISVSKTKEIPIDYVLSILNEREKVMNVLYEVIVEALYNRRIAIENRNNVFIEMQERQKRLIKERDEMYHSIPTAK